MSYWNFAPGSLEGYEDLELLARKYYREIQLIFDERVDSGEGLVDSEFEWNHINLKGATDAFSAFMMGKHSIDAEAAAYRAVHFAYFMRQQMVSAPVPMRFYPYIDELAKQENPNAEHMVCDMEEYLQPRQALGSLMLRYQTYIDTSGQFPVVANTMAALTLMQFDVNTRNYYLDQLASANLNSFETNVSIS